MFTALDLVDIVPIQQSTSMMLMFQIPQIWIEKSLIKIETKLRVTVRADNSSNQTNQALATGLLNCNKKEDDFSPSIILLYYKYKLAAPMIPDS